MPGIPGRFGKPFPNVNKETAKPLELARILAGFIYPPGYADTLMSASDVNYQLSFDDASEVPKERRAELAALLRDGYFSINPDMTLKPNRPFTRARSTARSKGLARTGIEPLTPGRGSKSALLPERIRIGIPASHRFS